LREITRDANLLVRRIYGDWTTNSMNGWKEKLFRHPIRAVQQFRTGENATDNAIIMDAIELTFLNAQVDSICIASTDTDFYSLALRLREKGLYVLGIGKKNANPLWVNSCNKFTFLENIVSSADGTINKLESSDSTEQVSIISILDYAIANTVAQENDLFRLSDIGKTIRNRFPGFDPRDYNHSSLVDLIRGMKESYDLVSDGLTPPNFSIRRTNIENDKFKRLGSIKLIRPAFGIITNEKGDYYFSITNIEDNSRGLLRKGDSVGFEELNAPDSTKTESSESNGRAVKVRRIKA
jgi:hypothetical protein